MSHDDYASRESVRNRAYRSAYESAETKKWMESLSPESLARAQKLGLLEPRLDWAVNGHRNTNTVPDTRCSFTVSVPGNNRT